MNFWRTLAGASIGVGAVAAAPFTGGGSLLGAASLAGSLAGAGTIAAAVGAGAAGAAIGANLQGKGPEGWEEGYQEGQKDARAEYQVRMEKLELRLQALFAASRDSGRFFEDLLAMQAVALSCANCDGTIDPDERAQIEMFIEGVSGSRLPRKVKRDIQDLYDHPPGIRTAFERARQSDVDMEIFDEIIDIVMNADGIIHSKEKAFRQAWQTLQVA